MRRDVGVAGALVMLVACGEASPSEATSAGTLGTNGVPTTGSSGTGGESSSGGEGTGGEATSAGSSSTGMATEGSSSGDSTGGSPTDTVDPTTTTGPAPDLGCSQDLKSVVDLDTEEVVETCPPDQGCLDGECVAACDAADASQGSMGCGFYVPTSPFYANGNPSAQTSGPCHAVMIANPWDQPAIIDLSYEGVDYDVTLVGRIPNGVSAATVYDPIPATGIPPGDVAVVFLSHRPGVSNITSLECPIAPAVLEDTATHGTASGTTFTIASDTPIQLYDILPYGGASSYLPSASLLFPHSSWGTDYVANAPHTETGSKWLIAVGSQDGTTLEINPTNAMDVGSIANPPVGQATSYTLNAGETLQWTSNFDLGGTLVTADQPVAMFSGNTYLRVSTADGSNSGQDSAHQQIRDVNALASEYVGAGLVSRFADGHAESVLYRVVGVVEDTTLTWDPAPPTGAPVALGVGEVVEFESTELFSVQSQDGDHPFALSQYMSGALFGPGCAGGASCDMGDDEWVVVAPPPQFLDAYAFFVDPTYATTNLVVTRVADEDGFHPVSIDCMGEIESWQPVGAEGLYEVAHVNLFLGGTGSVPTCETSQQGASSDGNFGITVWGIDSYASYGYPAGGSLAPINEVEILPG
jgi:hypothetical protein